MNAAKVKTAAKPTMIAISFIKVSDDNPRVELRDLEELAASIKKRGIIQPLVVRDLPDFGAELIAGHRRLEAAKMAGLKEVPCVLRDAKGSLEVEHLIENTQRDDLTPLEIGIAVYTSIFNGTKQNELSAELGKSAAWVSKYNTIGHAADTANDDQMAQLVSETDGEKCYAIACEILGRGKVSTSKTGKKAQAELPLPDSIDQVLAMRAKDKGCGTIEDIIENTKERDEFVVSLIFKDEAEAIRFFS
ncbi:ParB/RepB/Spo0J family partition protein [Stenotrophobium rhamnosiphilum]|uniref:ParB-like N-terminal domain-containing protein n=1 Tax=Stenotrophobium rhamnosiphilum TaxID=2029166 RepID=A0A2T5MKD5_9GAMM|nr:ParB/RepB/Spo0J family partition protein [Stenotrophobium rhamnosiphilum]PTU33030.1 hypothetical protein CJD38_02670 [Stenotrophobium rhamnosiphilum]